MLRIPFSVLVAVGEALCQNPTFSYHAFYTEILTGCTIKEYTLIQVSSKRLNENSAE